MIEKYNYIDEKRKKYFKWYNQLNLYKDLNVNHYMAKNTFL